MLDPHLLMLHSDGAISTDLHGEMASTTKNRTVGMQISAQLYPEDEQVTENRLKGEDLPGLEKIYSPFTAKLKKREEQMENTMSKLRGEESRSYDASQMLRKYEKILFATKQSTRAGTAHYQLLFDSLNLQDMSSPVLLNAKNYWARHRATIETEIADVMEQLRRQDVKKYATTLPHYKAR